MQERSKLSYIKNLETPIDCSSDVDTRPKYFITFPYPYMNGKLHLGHLFSISKSDFFSYFKRLEGYNVLFPFSFHCTGMPISASARKLTLELEGQVTDISTKEIIESMGFDDVRPFTKPEYWIRTFPNLAKNSLINFHSGIDWRRSFISTDLNPLHDLFVKWQFTRLKKLKLLSFGRRHSIYCPIDKQACLDHDRRKGENLKPMVSLLLELKFDGGILLLRTKPFTLPTRVVLSSTSLFTVFAWKGNIYYCEEDVYNNLIYQFDGLQYLKNVDISHFVGVEVFATFDREIGSDIIDKDMQCIVKGQSFSCISNEKDVELADKLSDLNLNEPKMSLDSSCNFSTCAFHSHASSILEFYEPEGEVISRAGGRCVVALLDQWYIDYDNLEWKKKVERCIYNLVCTEDTRDKLLDSCGWINKWAFSRSFGLGTKVPWDEEYLIDSLSDSTAYMALYTFKNLLFSDFECKISNFEPCTRESLGDDKSKTESTYGRQNQYTTEEIYALFKTTSAWDYIFYDASLDEDLVIHKPILDKCQQAFNYYYPVDLRVSGKDLLKNHLIFYLFNHVALFNEEHWPKRIYTNGYLMLNSEKMSKSSGNFMTVDDTLEKFGTSATRMCLAVCGDTNEDANFEEGNANSFILKLYSFIKAIEAHFDSKEVHECLCAADSITQARINQKSKMKYDDERNEGLQDENNKQVSLESSNNVVHEQNELSCSDDKHSKQLNDGSLRGNYSATIEGSNNSLLESRIASSCDSLSFEDKFFIQSVSKNIRLSIYAHENMIYRDVVKYAFYEMTHLKEMYTTLKGSNMLLLTYYYKSIVQLLYPIIPSLCASLIRKYFYAELRLPYLIVNDEDVIAAIEHLKMISKRVMNQKKRKKVNGVVIYVGKDFPSWKQECMLIVDEFKKRLLNSKNVNVEAYSTLKQKCDSFSGNILADSSLDSHKNKKMGVMSKLDASKKSCIGKQTLNSKNLDHETMSLLIAKLKVVFETYHTVEKKGLLFSMDYFNRPFAYRLEFDEFGLLSRFKYYIEDSCSTKVIVKKGNGEPGSPLIEFT